MSNENYKFKAGMKVITTQWTIQGEADPSKLSDSIIDFCSGRRIFVVVKTAVDGMKVTEGIIYSKVYLLLFSNLI